MFNNKINATGSVSAYSPKNKFGRKAPEGSKEFVTLSQNDSSVTYSSPTKRECITITGSKQLVCTMPDGSNIYVDESPDKKSLLLSRFRGQKTESYTTDVLVLESGKRAARARQWMPKAFTTQKKQVVRKLFPDGIGPVLDNTHVIADWAHAKAGSNSYTKENIVVAPAESNSALMLLEEPLAIISDMGATQLYYWGDVERFVEQPEIAKQITLYVAVEKPKWQFAFAFQKQKRCTTPYYSIKFNALLQTKPAIEIESRIYHELNDFISSEVLRLSMPAIPSERITGLSSIPASSSLNYYNIDILIGINPNRPVDCSLTYLPGYGSADLTIPSPLPKDTENSAVLMQESTELTSSLIASSSIASTSVDSLFLDDFHSEDSCLSLPETESLSSLDDSDLLESHSNIGDGGIFLDEDEDEDEERTKENKHDSINDNQPLPVKLKENTAVVHSIYPLFSSKNINHKKGEPQCCGEETVVSSSPCSFD